MKRIVSILLCGILIWFYLTTEKDTNLEYRRSEDIQISSQNATDEVTSIDEFENIEIGSSKDELLNKIGEPARIDESEYDFKWYVYNQYKGKFVMVGVENDSVVALYSNSINSCEMENISLSNRKEDVRAKYEPLDFKKKGHTRYIINSNDQYDIIKINKKYITVFYDIYEDNKVCSYQIISESAEQSLDGMYPNESQELRKSFELQIIDLTNSVRDRNNQNRLQYSEKATQSARKHSEDMMQKDYFDHINTNNETPFDRMKYEDIVYRGAGENIAAGQTSAIYAHEAWMNSEGHRNNILGNYKYIGVGVSFGGGYIIYYTQNFYI